MACAADARRQVTRDKRGIRSIARNRRDRRFGAFGLLLVAISAGLWLPAAAAAGKSDVTIAPIIGTWKSGNAVIRVTGPINGPYQGVIVSGALGSSCTQLSPPGTVIWENLQGSNFQYNGKVPFVRTDDCSSVGDGSASFTLGSINSGEFLATSPADGSSFTLSMNRIGVWPGASRSLDTSCKKGGNRVLCRGQKQVYKDLAHLAGKRRSSNSSSERRRTRTGPSTSQGK